MIHPLRKRHRSILTFIAVALPVLFVLGIVFRPVTPKGDPDSDRFLSKLNPFPHTVWTDNNLWRDFAPIQTRLLTDQASPPHLAVELSVRENIIIPDLLVYWSSEPSSEEILIPDNALLLGVFNTGTSKSYLLPPQSKDKDGHLILFSLAYQRAMASTSIKTASALDTFKN